jgi:hypothetical protein
LGVSSKVTLQILALLDSLALRLTTPESGNHLTLSMPRWLLSGREVLLITVHEDL